MVSFRGETAEVILAPTTSLAMARRKLKALPTGGATPLADGLMKAWRLIKTERLKDPGIRPLMVLLSDGEANVPYDAGRKLSEVQDELLAIAKRIARDKISSISIDTRPLREPSENMRRIADALGGRYEHIGRLKAGGMVRMVAGFQHV